MYASQIKGIPEFIVSNTNFKREEVINNRLIDKIIFNASARVYEGGDEAVIIRLCCTNWLIGQVINQELTE